MNRQPNNNQVLMEFGDSLAPVWRPIHYLGSKLRLTEEICEFANQLDPTGGRVCDVFAGSGTVAMALARTRTVLAADIQEYSRVLCSAVLNPRFPAEFSPESAFDPKQRDEKLIWCMRPLVDLEHAALENAHHSPAMLCDIVEKGSLILDQEPSGELGRALRETQERIKSCGSESSLRVSRYFGGVYFSYEQSLAVDQLLNHICKLPPDCRDTATAMVLSSVSSVANTIGNQFAQPIRPRNKDGDIKHHLISKMVRDRTRSIGDEYVTWSYKYRVLPRGEGHVAIRGDYRDVLVDLDDVSLVYADPPYTRDHYSRFYHVLETIALQDSPSVTTTSLKGKGAKSRGIYRHNRHQSPFSIKTQAPSAFDELFRLSRETGASMLLSYSPFIKNGHPRMMAIENITEIASKYFESIDVVSAGEIAHSKLNRMGLHLEVGAEAEVFILCRP